jgi:DNA-binding response OmpR family regulator
VDVVFCSHDKAVYSRLVRQYAPVPVIIATRLPEMADWLDALETGAADYCAAPFEPTQLRWLMDTHAPLVRHAAA